jgi:hypothetical protein
MKEQIDDFEIRMAKIEGDAPAFPTNNKDGITVIDYFAAKVMQALIMKLGPYEDDVARPGALPSGREDVPHTKQIAEYAYAQAAEMCLVRRLQD